jgi:hypothetical protein
MSASVCRQLASLCGRPSWVGRDAVEHCDRARQDHDAVAVTIRRVPQCQSTVVWCVDSGSVGSLDMARKDMNVPVKDERMEDLTSGRMDPTPRSTTYQ